MLDDRRRLAERSARVSDPGALVRFVTVCYWDDVAGVCGVELATGLVRERPATFFPILKRNEQEHGQRIDADTWHAWLLESHPRRVVMLTSYVLGPARGTDTPQLSLRNLSASTSEEDR
jgi:hypothetical protein